MCARGRVTQMGALIAITQTRAGNYDDRRLVRWIAQWLRRISHNESSRNHVVDRLVVFAQRKCKEDGSNSREIIAIPFAHWIITYLCTCLSDQKSGGSNFSYYFPVVLGAVCRQQQRNPQLPRA